MNKWNRLLATLDQVYGFEDKQESTFRKVAQHYDERTNEHVVIIEYRIRRGDGFVRKKKSGGNLIRQINAQVRRR